MKITGALVAIGVTMACGVSRADGTDRTAVVAAERFMSNLRVKYGKQIHYGSDAAREIVSREIVRCPTADGRVIPLEHLLLVRLARIDDGRVSMSSEVRENRGEVRIFDVLRFPSGVTAEPVLSFQISKWGDLQPVGVRPEAVLNTCFGTSGPIWVFEGKAVAAKAQVNETTAPQKKLDPTRDNPTAYQFTDWRIGKRFTIDHQILFRRGTQRDRQAWTEVLTAVATIPAERDGGFEIASVDLGNSSAGETVILRGGECSLDGCETVVLQRRGRSAVVLLDGLVLSPNLAVTKELRGKYRALLSTDENGVVRNYQQADLPTDGSRAIFQTGAPIVMRMDPTK